MKVEAHCFRTKIIGGGNAYDVYIPTKFKDYRPISGHCYATVIHLQDEKYYSVDNFLRTPEIDSLPAFSDIRWNTFKELEMKADRIAFETAKKAFPELNSLKKLPTLWAVWEKDLPSAKKVIDIEIELGL